MKVVGQGIRLVESESATTTALSSAPETRVSGVAPAGLGWQFGGVVVVVLLAVLMLRRGMRRSGREEEVAFAGMCRRLKLGQRHAALVRRLAAGMGAAPVALLISESAFERAVRGAGKALESAAARRTAIEVRARVFAG